MEILIMEKTNLYFGVILGVRIATLCDSGTPLSYWTQAGVLAPYTQMSIPSHKILWQYAGKEAKRAPNNPEDPEISLIQKNMQVTPRLYETVCAPHIFLLGMTRTPRPREGKPRKSSVLQ